MTGRWLRVTVRLRRAVVVRRRAVVVRLDELAGTMAIPRSALIQVLLAEALATRERAWERFAEVRNTQ